MKKIQKNQFLIKKHLIVTIFLAVIVMLSPFTGFFQTSRKCLADTGNGSSEIYLVYDENNKVIFESNIVEVGDKIIDKNLREYEIYEVDDNLQVAYAEYNGKYLKPKIEKKSSKLNFSNKNVKKSVGIYMTHNDESYVPTDGTSSVYGKGGVHDVGRELVSEFKKLGYSTYFDESLHLPHDSKAYVRSSATAKSLLSNNVDALFDIHRDGVARSVYVKNVDGVERCKVRIVVGQANPNKDANLQFAMYLVSVAEEYCPWLFLDIYYAKGHYNQALTSKGLLFEMGTHLAEKEIVLKSVPYLAQVVDKTLFSTQVEDDNSLTITDKTSEIDEEKTVNSVLETVSENTFNSKYTTNILIFACVFGITTVAVVVGAVLRKKRRN